MTRTCFSPIVPATACVGGGIICGVGLSGVGLGCTAPVDILSLLPTLASSAEPIDKSRGLAAPDGGRPSMSLCSGFNLLKVGDSGSSSSLAAGAGATGGRARSGFMRTSAPGALRSARGSALEVLEGGREPGGATCRSVSDNRCRVIPTLVHQPYFRGLHPASSDFLHNMDALQERVQASYASSVAQYEKRIASGQQPAPPEFVTSQPWLSFLDYRNNTAILAANAAYLVRATA